MSTLRDRIKRHLELSERLHKAALEVLKAKIVDEKLKNKKILEVASKYGFTNTKLKQKVKILREKKDYLVSKKKIESIVEKMQDVQCTDSVKDICEKHNLKSTLISTELRKYRRLHGRYQYDKPIRCHGYFTYLNEFSMLEHLKTWKQTDRISSCHCKTCALEYLPKWAYIFAKDQKIDYRNSWDTKKEANVEWVLEFEMRHYNEIIKSEFKSPNLCKYDHPQLYTSGRQTPCDISLPASTSQALQTKNSQSDQENFNVLTKRIRMEDQQSTSWSQPQYDESSYAPQPIGSQSDQENFNVPPISEYRMEDQPSTSKCQPQYDESSHTHQPKDTKSYQEVFGVPPISEYRMEDQPSTSKCQPQYDESSHTHQPKDTKSYQEVSGIPMADRDRIRKKLKKYFEEDDVLVPAAQEVIDGGKDIEEVAQNYGFEPSLKLSLKLKTNIVQEKKRYWEIKDKIEEAVKHAFFFDEDIKFVAIQRGLDPTVLTYEFNKCRTVMDFTTYKYNVEKLSANSDGDFTYMEERSLMDELRNVLRISFLVDQWQICCCKICIFECFRNLLFQSAKDQNKQCYSEWSKNENSYFKWLFQFIIGYTKEISELKFSNFCKVEPKH